MTYYFMVKNMDVELAMDMDLGMVAWNIGLYMKMCPMLLIELVTAILIGAVILADQMNLMNKIRIRYE